QSGGFPVYGDRGCEPVLSSFRLCDVSRFSSGGEYLPVHFLAIYLGGLPYRDIFSYDLEMCIPNLR
ncbi:hypothetical protein, partial [Marinobacter sp.]|uniref:hypothetical protein n=1 Tax=Marinobacter sp. TaxID=50741 RepID=UPI003565EF18